jgi:hypothetical protein
MLLSMHVSPSNLRFIELPRKPVFLTQAALSFLYSKEIPGQFFQLGHGRFLQQTLPIYSLISHFDAV